MRLSTRARELQPSPTLAIDGKAKELARAGVDVVNLAAGEPDFDTPKSVVEAAHAAARAGKTRYTAVAGVPELREAIAGLATRSLGFPVRAESVVVSNGAKQSLFNALQVLVEPGDEIVVLSPYWVSYPEIVRLAGGRVVDVPVDARTLEPDADHVARACTPRTRGLIVNSPNNPTGAVYGRACLESLVRVARERDLWILSDEIYDRLVYDGAEHVSPAQLGDEGRARTLVVNGFSKSFAMTGWRLGYLIAPPEIASAATTLQGQVTSNVNTPAQWAAVAALQADPAELRAMVGEFAARRARLVAAMREIVAGRAPVPEPKGAFYLLQDVRPFLGRSSKGTRLATDADFASALLEHARVASVPGSAFGAPGHVRFSYATSRENLHRGMERLAAFLGSLTP